MESCMNWGMVVAIIGTNLALMACLITIVLWIFGKLDNDIKRLDADIKSLGNKIDNDSRCHSQRLDQLYGMFIDLLKSQGPKTNP